MACWAFDRIHLLDRGCLERLRIHRESGVNHFSRSRAFDQYAVHTFPTITAEPSQSRLSHCSARKVPDFPVV
jgi:hypothetical protein